jgi:hypothetical protein
LKRRQNAVDIAEHVIVPEAKHPVAVIRQASIAHSIRR